MNILDKVYDILGMQNVKMGYMPDKPDSMIGLYEYPARPPDHSFGKTDITHCVQARCRAESASDAYALAVSVSSALNRHHDITCCILQSTTILDIGRDSEGRQEYTVNFEIRRY